MKLLKQNGFCVIQTPEWNTSKTCPHCLEQMMMNIPQSKHKGLQFKTCQTLSTLLVQKTAKEMEEEEEDSEEVAAIPKDKKKVLYFI